jgi:hypothetical protein
MNHALGNNMKLTKGAAGAALYRDNRANLRLLDTRLYRKHTSGNLLYSNSSANVRSAGQRAASYYDVHQIRSTSSKPRFYNYRGGFSQDERSQSHNKNAITTP